jgi:hypothetical protein
LSMASDRNATWCNMTRFSRPLVRPSVIRAQRLQLLLQNTGLRRATRFRCPLLARRGRVIARLGRQLLVCIIPVAGARGPVR